ncbi:LytTR family DNA-binding domain-containing protein [Kordia algicida OT-1]|uniref:Two-component system response regulator protein n=1 Tax=Kordia algicida OT-1 TaxID=391587 RepID=A9DVF1_9FLAO|nr:LytTR family DNA-binding domain-containing protein [Kordia algicida]EDP96413.1 two-component system response regulator protein [Kordia algicida OT-1]
MNCIIIEDEVPAQEILRTYIEKIPELELKGVFNSPIKANSILKQEQIDVMFLDINLPAISGLDFLKTIQYPPRVIMTTAYTDYAVESFEFDTIIDYLVKPFSFERFLKSINKLSPQLPNATSITENETIDVTTDNDTIFINVDKTLHKVNLADVIHVQSDRNYVTVTTKNSKYTFIDTLKNWKEYLVQDYFIQIHKSFIVNIHCIEKITGNLVYINQEKIPVGRSYREQLFNKIKPIN